MFAVFFYLNVIFGDTLTSSDIICMGSSMDSYFQLTNRWWAYQFLRY